MQYSNECQSKVYLEQWQIYIQTSKTISHAFSIAKQSESEQSEPLILPLCLLLKG